MEKGGGGEERTEKSLSHTYCSMTPSFSCSINIFYSQQHRYSSDVSNRKEVGKTNIDKASGKGEHSGEVMEDFTTEHA